MTLGEAFRIHEGEVISLIGAGGKTSLLFALGRELSCRRRGVVLTTTTKIYEPPPAPDFALFLSREISEMKEWVSRNLQVFPFLLVACAKRADGKLEGIDPGWVEEIRALPGVSAVIVEADGAAGRPLKAPREGEPVFPQSTTLVIPVMGIEALGRPLEEEHVFRSAIASRLLAVAGGSTVTPPIAAALLQKLAESAPKRARVIPFINKMDLPGAIEKGRMLAKELLEQQRIEKVILGRAMPPPVVDEVIVGATGRSPLQRN